MAGGNSKIKIGSNDTIIISASPIPGNEKMVYNVINSLYRLGARVIYEALAAVHVSGHACKEELKTTHALIRPSYFIPVHGEYRHLSQHVDLARSMGISEANTLIPELGDYIEVSKKGLVKKSKVTSGQLLVDGTSIGDKTSLVLRDRLHLAEDGFLIVVVSASQETGLVNNPPELIAKGFNFEAGMEDEAIRIVESVMKNFEKTKFGDPDEIKSAISRAMKKFFYKRKRQSPMIMPVILVN
jgi:ribonuclease J